MSFVKAAGVAGAVGVILATAVVMLWLKVQAMERCKDPEKSPCGICRFCVKKAHREERAEWRKTIEAQEKAHLKEVEIERTRIDALQEEHKKTLREFANLFRDSAEQA